MSVIIAPKCVLDYVAFFRNEGDSTETEVAARAGRLSQHFNLGTVRRLGFYRKWIFKKTLKDNIGNSSMRKAAAGGFTDLAPFPNESCGNARDIENRGYFCTLIRCRAVHLGFDRKCIFNISQSPWSHVAPVCQVSK